MHLAHTNTNKEVTQTETHILYIQPDTHTHMRTHTLSEAH